MKINYIGDDVTRLSDNELEIINIIILLLNYSDPECDLLLSKEPERIIGHITASNPDFRDDIIHNLLFINRTLKIKVEYSKSLAISTKISFQINL